MTRWSAIATTLLISLNLPAQQPEEKKDDPGAIGDEHRILAKLAGDFDIQQKEFGEEGKLKGELTGVLTRTMILDGRFLQEEAEVKGKSRTTKIMVTIGFDRRKKKFVSVTVNNQTTLPYVAEGTWDVAKKEITFIDEEFDPITMKLVARTREIHRILSDDEQLIEEYVALGDKSEYRTLEIRYTRKGK